MLGLGPLRELLLLMPLRRATVLYGKIMNLGRNCPMFPHPYSGGLFPDLEAPGSRSDCRETLAAASSKLYTSTELYTRCELYTITEQYTSSELYTSRELYSSSELYDN
jgi:hypothetical protein